MSTNETSALRDSVARINRKLDRLTERESQRSGSIVARLCACAVLSRIERRAIDAVAREHFGGDRDLAGLLQLKAGVAPAQTSDPAWAGALVATTVADL